MMEGANLRLRLAYLIGLSFKWLEPAHPCNLFRDFPSERYTVPSHFSDKNRKKSIPDRLRERANA